MRKVTGGSYGDGRRHITQNDPYKDGNFWPYSYRIYESISSSLSSLGVLGVRKTPAYVSDKKAGVKKLNPNWIIG